MSEYINFALLITIAVPAATLASTLILWAIVHVLMIFRNGRRAKREESLKQQAAALAVAVALAEHDETGVSRFPTPPTAIISAWQLSTRTRQMKHQE